MSSQASLLTSPSHAKHISPKKNVASPPKYQPSLGKEPPPLFPKICLPPMTELKNPDQIYLLRKERHLEQYFKKSLSRLVTPSKDKLASFALHSPRKVILGNEDRKRRRENDKTEHVDLSFKRTRLKEEVSEQTNEVIQERHLIETLTKLSDLEQQNEKIVKKEIPYRQQKLTGVDEMDIAVKEDDDDADLDDYTLNYEKEEEEEEESYEKGENDDEPTFNSY